jgi:hypothetical protein
VPAEIPNRRATGRRLTDDQVRAYVREHLQAQPAPVSATRLLRQLRASGRSCEQARFGRLYAALTSGGR